MSKQLTSQQEAIFLEYQQKWRKIALSTEPIDKEKAEIAVKSAYTLIGEPQPEVIIFDSPYAAGLGLDKLWSETGLTELYSDDMLGRLWDKLFTYLTHAPEDKEDPKLWHLTHHIHDLVTSHMWELDSSSDIGNIFIPEEFEAGNVQPDTACCEASWFDFCISELNHQYDSNHWEIYEAILKNCGWIASYQEACIVCERPCKILFDNQFNLHAEGEAAIEFIDGFKLYAHHGVIFEPD
ncbi:hypothetical protein RIVM261_070740 [Rivularia sp. IAM M-261]|nr:hypothetical protein RIVM261_070740 [Rivularia sp. IAM M-261]